MNTYNQHIRIEEDGSQELYPFDYLEFYESNIHPYEDFKLGNESKRIYGGHNGKRVPQETQGRLSERNAGSAE